MQEGLDQGFCLLSFPAFMISSFKIRLPLLAKECLLVDYLPESRECLPWGTLEGGKVVFGVAVARGGLDDEHLHGA